MTIEQLNQRFGAPGRIVFHEGFAGYPNVVIANKYGTAEIALLGANVLSYRPTGNAQVLFRPTKKDNEYNRADKFHGGIPVCWPQFGNCFSKELPQHGFARLMVFEVRGSEYSEDMTEVTLGLKSSEETRGIWNHEFDLEVKVSVSMKLNLSMETRNTGKELMEFSCGFHPYFLLRERNEQVAVRGLDGFQFIDWSGKSPVKCEQTGDKLMDGAADHIFMLPEAAKHEFAIIDSGLRRAIAIVSSGNNNAVVWNPGTAYIVDDHDSEDYRRFVCVEPVSDWPGGRKLAPGESYKLSAAIQVSIEQQ